MALKLEYTAKTTTPVEVEGVIPDTLSSLSIEEIEKLEIYHGNETVSLGDFFDVSGDPSDAEVDWHGDLSGVHWIGAKMTRGVMRIHDDVGRHLGSEMRGGEIVALANAADWVGAEMKGGQIRVHGNAGHLVGAAYRGSQRGMTNGTILIDGNAGNEIGHTLRRGMIVVGGNAGDLIGFNMLAGTIVVYGEVGIRHGAGMRRGTIGLFHSETQKLLPSFRFGCRIRPPFVTPMLRQFDQLNFPVPELLRDCEFDLFHGDLIEGGRGEILMPAN